MQNKHFKVQLLFISAVVSIVDATCNYVLLHILALFAADLLLLTMNKIVHQEQ